MNIGDRPILKTNAQKSRLSGFRKTGTAMVEKNQVMEHDKEPTTRT